MREIKFRAYLKELKIISPVHSINFQEQLLFVIVDDKTTWKYGLDEVELMQYTGIKDKNGNMIFELHELNNKYRVVYKFNRYVLQSISNSDIFTEILEYEEYQITGEYSPLS